MRVGISGECLIDFADLSVGVCVIRNLNNVDSGDEDVLSLIRCIENVIREDWNKDNLLEHPAIKNSEEAGSTMIKNKLSGLIDGYQYEEKNNLLDVCEYMRLRHMSMIQAVEAKVTDEIILKGIGKENMVICPDRPVTDDTVDACIFFLGNVMERDKQRILMFEFMEWAKKMCGGILKGYILDIENRMVDC